MKPNKANDVRRIRRTIMPILKRNGVSRAGIFGSYAKGKAKKKSDVDILVKFRGKKSLLSLASLEIQLEKRLGRKADVITYNSIHPMLKSRIMSEEVRIL
ncbi:MAG: nucleotidyltransferase family protein [Nanoarchaeota archaeon]|nr:nucleotidyltransferase family protein [Nanoarchaeota archaeon]